MVFTASLHLDIDLGTSRTHFIVSRTFPNFGTMCHTLTQQLEDVNKGKRTPETAVEES